MSRSSSRCGACPSTARNRVRFHPLGTSSSFSQNLSDWASPQHFSGESAAVALPYRLTADGSKDSRTFYAFAYSFPLATTKAVRSVSLPGNRDVLVFAITLVPAKK